MAINWNQLRPWNGDQRLAFEELSAQLAYAERDELSVGAEFFRKGTPDAGVECYWKLPSGDEWAWQAKFFRESPGVSQWQQIDESFNAAFEAH